MKASPELREKMWELCYDLLPDGERSALIAQIKSDPHAARLYAEVRLQADLVGYASKVEDSSLNLSADAEKLKTMELAPAAARRKEAAEPTSSAPYRSSPKSPWGANAVAIAAGLALVLVMAVGFFRPSDIARQMTQLVVTELEVPGQLTPGLTTEFVVHTQSPAGGPVGVPLDVKVVDQGGAVRFHEEIRTAADGRGTFEVRGEAMVPGVRLQVEARSEQLAEQQVAQQSAGDLQGLGVNLVEAELPVARQEPLAYYLMEKPVVQVGEQVRFALWGLDRFRLDAAAPPVGDVVVKDQETTRIIQPKWATSGNVAVAEGTIGLSRDPQEHAPLQPSTPAHAEKSEARDQLSLVQVERAKDFAEALAHRRTGDAGNAPAAAVPPAPTQLTQEQYRLQAETLDAGPKLATADAAGGEPSKEFGKAKQDAAKSNGAQKQRRVIAAGNPVEFEVPADQVGKAIEATVMARGVEVARQRVEPKFDRYLNEGKELEELPKVTVNVPPEVDGNLDVTWVETSASGEKVVREHRLYRTPARELKFQALNLQERYDPGERVQLKLKVVNENNEPQVASLGARLWNEDYVPDDRTGLVMLADVVRHPEIRETSGTLHGELAQLGRPSSGDKGAVAMGAASRGGTSEGAIPPGASATGALDQIAQSDDRKSTDLKKVEQAAAGSPPLPAPAPTGPAPAAGMARSKAGEGEGLEPVETVPEDASFDKKTNMLAENATLAFAAASAEAVSDGSAVTVTSNKAAIDRQVQALKSDSARALAAWQAIVGRVLIGGGLVALAILGMLFVMQQEVRWSSGTLALVASAASLVIGAVWISGDRQEMNIAMATSRGDDAPKAASPAPAEDPPMADSRSNVADGVKGSLSANAPAADTYAGQAMPAVAPATTPAPPNEVDASFRSLEPAALPLAAAQADKSAAEAKGAEQGIEKVAPAKPAVAGDPGGKNQETFEKKQQLAGNLLPSTPQPAGGRGGFDGGLLGGEPGGVPGEPAPTTFDRQRSLDRSNIRAGGAARPASSSVPPAPAAPGVAADALRDRVPEGEKSKAADEAAAPSAIYFNPQLATDGNGIVTIEFQLPEVASEYRLLLDAYGNGRVGSSAELRIVCKAAE